MICCCFKSADRFDTEITARLFYKGNAAAKNYDMHLVFWNYLERYSIFDGI